MFYFQSTKSLIKIIKATYEWLISLQESKALLLYVVKVIDLFILSKKNYIENIFLTFYLYSHTTYQHYNFYSWININNHNYNGKCKRRPFLA